MIYQLLKKRKQFNHKEKIQIIKTSEKILWQILTYSPLRERSDFAFADGKDMRSPMGFKYRLPVAVVETAS